MYTSHRAKGFTLVEILIAVAIIGILASILLVGMQNAYRKARDTQRMSDLQQLQVSLRLYKDVYGAYPDDAGSPSEILAAYLNGEMNDPLDDATHQYWYDSNYSCDGVSQEVLYAETMELPQNSNHDMVCGTSGSEAYIIILP